MMSHQKNSCSLASNTKQTNKIIILNNCQIILGYRNEKIIPAKSIQAHRNFNNHFLTRKPHKLNIAYVDMYFVTVVTVFKNKLKFILQHKIKHYISLQMKK